MRRVAMMVAGALALAVVPGARAGQPEACMATEPATPLSPNPCRYEATVKGGIDAVGDWTVRIAHRGRRTLVIDSRRLPSSCAATGPRAICPIGTIRAGDVVTSRARSPGSFVGTGNPCPIPNPGLPPPIAGGEC